MRFRFKPTSEQRTALRRQMVRLQQPAAALEMLHAILPSGFKATDVICTLQSVHPDRFVMRVQARSVERNERAYALKVYSDDFVQQVWTYSQSLAEYYQPTASGLCLPLSYVPQERALIFDWVEGEFLSEIVDERKPGLLRRAARIAADLHRLAIVPEERTTAQMIVEETLARCGRLLDRWPETTQIIEPLIATLQEAVSWLESTAPAPIHGDMAARQFLWTGDRLVLLDLDMFGYADPAYDAGHFLAQLERRCVVDPSVRCHAAQWLDAFRDTYLAAVPTVSPRNISFYRGLTLIRKIYTLCRREPDQWPRFVPQLAERAETALREVLSPELIR